MPATTDTLRRIAVSLPDAYESAHMNHPDFRVRSPDGRGRIFATLASQDKGLGNINLTPEQQQAFVAEMPLVFEPISGGWVRMGMTHIHLSEVDEDTLLGALTTAHRNVVAKLAAGKAKPALRKRAVKKAPRAIGDRGLE